LAPWRRLPALVAFSVMLAWLAVPTHAQGPDAQAGGTSFEVVGDVSEARYRVDEQLAGVTVRNDAVGVTRAVSGGVVVREDGSVLAGSAIVVDVSVLASDQRMRDNYISRNTLQTDRYPSVTFVPTAIRGVTFPLALGGLPSEALPVEIDGELTIKDVTRAVTWTGTVVLAADSATLDAGVVVTFEEFGITKPRVARVLSVSDEIRLEVSLSFARP